MYIHILLSWPGEDPEFRVENSCHIIKLFAKCVFILIENIDRFYDCYSSGDVFDRFYDCYSSGDVPYKDNPYQ